MKDNTAPVLAGVLPGGSGLQCLAGVPAAPAPAVIAALYTDNCTSVTATFTGTTTTGSNSAGWTVKYNYKVSDANGIM